MALAKNEKNDQVDNTPQQQSSSSSTVSPPHSEQGKKIPSSDLSRDNENEMREPLLGNKNKSELSTAASQGGGDGGGGDNSGSYLVYDLFRMFWSLLVVTIFFREVDARNSHSIPKTGPIIFVVAPHHNQVRQTKRRIPERLLQ